jgi:Bacterial regulatory proteins, tetR family
MGESVLTTDRILEVAVVVLRRFGPDKATVIDVARALGVTHGSVYRSKGLGAGMPATKLDRRPRSTRRPSRKT